MDPKEEYDNIIELRKKLTENPYSSEDYKVIITNGQSELSTYVTLMGNEITEVDLRQALMGAFGIKAIERFVKRSELMEFIPRLELLRDNRKITMIFETRHNTPEKYVEIACSDAVNLYKDVYKDNLPEEK